MQIVINLLSRICFIIPILFFLSNGSFSQAPSIVYKNVGSGLFTPVDIVNAGDNTNRLFVVSLKGATITVLDQNHNSLGTLLTVTDVRISGSEEGLLSMAFHPDYETNRYFWVYYTNTNGDLELSRYQTTAGNPNLADAGSKVIVLTIPHPGNSNHNGAKLNFGADGYLYFATGDGGGADDQPNNAQNGNTLLGKMLRINVTTQPGGPFYTIPPDNPFLPSPFRDEIWALGLRNPFRWSFDRVTGDMWIGDVGQDQVEEINFRSPAQSAGANYGWRCYEGTLDNNTSGCGPLSNYVSPVYQYPNPNGSGSPASAVTGGYVYRGTGFPALVGYYLATDYYSRAVYLIKPDGLGGWNTTVQPGLPVSISGFGEAENGELYAVGPEQGILFKVEAVSQSPTPVTLVSFSGRWNNGTVELNWETKNEVNVLYYDIEYGLDGAAFTKAGTIQADKRGVYSFNHIVSGNSKLFYRLRINDVDGRFRYSNIIQVNITSGNVADFVRPSIITSNTIQLFLDKSYEQAELINFEGKVVWKKVISGRSGVVRFSLPVLPRGIYLARIFGMEATAIQRITIQ